MNVKDTDFDKNGIPRKPVKNMGPQQKVEPSGEAEEEDDETKSLLSPREGGLSNKSSKPRRKVQWNDKIGNKLAEVLEYQPSDSSASDDDEDSESCLCCVM